MRLQRDWKRLTGWATAVGAIIAVLSTGYTWIHGIKSDQEQALQQAEERHTQYVVQQNTTALTLAFQNKEIDWLMNHRDCKP